MEDVIFPPKIGRIKEVKHGSFPIDSGVMHSAEIEMDNGDVFKVYNISKKFITSLNVNVKIEYTLHKTEGKTKVKNVKVKKPMKVKPLISNLDGTSIHDLLFIDVGTASAVENIKAKTSLYDSWAYKRRNEDETKATELKASYKDKAPLYVEFNKIVCISISMIKPDGEIFTQSYYGDLEKDILIEFKKVLSKFLARFPKLRLCGHSIIGFDIPVIAKRMVVNGIRVPEFLNTFEVKPWELSNRFVDTAVLWKATNFYGTSLVNLTEVLGIPSPKTNLQGNEVNKAYYKGDIVNVVKYCEQDVFAVINVMEHLYNLEKSSTFTSKTFEDE